MKFSFYFISIILALSLNAHMTHASAPVPGQEARQKQADVRSDEKTDIPYLDDQTEQKLDEAHEKISETFLNAAQWLDAFFDDSRYSAEDNETRVKLTLSAGYERHDGSEFKPSLSVRLKLPNTTGKLNLNISISDDEDFDMDRNPLSSAQADHEGTDQENLTAGFRWFFSKSERNNFSTDIGASTSNVHIGFRYRGYYDYGSWKGRFVDRGRYYSDSGFENKAQYDLERHISEKFFFRTSVRVDWYEEKSGVPHGLIFYLDQVLGPEKAIRYQWGNYFETSPNYYMSDLQLSLRYRQRFYRDWLVFEISPQISFPSEHDREINPGIILKLEADFGYKGYLKDFSNIFKF